MRALEFLAESDFRYVGNCSDQHCSDHLADMMEKAKEIRYSTFVAAVGLDNVRQVFADYAWGHQRHDIRMKNDPYVRYFKSTYDGAPCYYIRHSGIEYIFVPGDYEAGKQQMVPVKPNKFSIMPDGDLVKGHQGRSTFHGTKTPTSLTVFSSSEPTKQAALTMTRMIKQSKLEMINMDDNEEEAKETLRWLAKYL